MSIAFADTKEVGRLLERLAADHPGGGVIFDADGTLWTHDVGCMVFEQAIGEDLFQDKALSALLDEAKHAGLTPEAGASATDVSRSLMSALMAGSYDERAAAEMQVWAYAGLLEGDFRALCRRALQNRGHQTGLHHGVLELARGARELGLFVGIVSASPRWVVEEAARDLGFDSACIEGGDPCMADGAIAVGMTRPLPYGPDKVTAGRRLLGQRPWLASFGDSSFDLEMMREALLAVGLGARPSMLSGLAHHPWALRLKNP